NNGYYNGYRRLNPSVGYNSVTGNDAPRNALINVYDSYNNRIGSGYSDSYGNYNISFSSSYQGPLSGIYATVADYNGYNNGYYNGYRRLNPSVGYNSVTGNDAPRNALI
ncbi:MULTISPECIES: hypothetical protein, partial [unclassified Desulfovibrio]|uniref:hypothetical protein n=1 Tax=unclassified Desulfovibrio TaxID=2593640 RepID=UPI001C8ADBB6